MEQDPPRLMRQGNSRLPMPFSKFLSSLMILLIFVQLSSCVPVQEMIYLQSEDESLQGSVYTHKNQDYKLQLNDILDVKITSLDPEINQIFNASTLGAMQVTQASAQTGGDLYYLTGYSISETGEVDIPFIGNVEVAGLSLTEAHAAIEERVGELFTNYHLQVKLGGIRFSALGEFNKPGKHVVMQNHVTIFEALALGGDLTPVANRRQIKLIRQCPEGTRIYDLNLLDQKIVGTPQYFIHPNDVIYAEPLQQRSWGVGITGAQTFTTIISALSTSIALTLSIITLTR